MKALLVDGLNLVRRIYAALPEGDGRPANADHDPNADAARVATCLASSTDSLRRALNQHQPTHCLTVFDFGGRNWRHELFADYKKNRTPMPEPLRNGLAQFERAFGAIGKLGVRCISLKGYEADDVIATVAAKTEQHGGQALILSTDRNYCQLLSANIKVFDHFGQRYLDDAMIEKKFQITPQQLPDLLSLAGDSGLSIPGIKTIGIRTAAKLLGDYASLEKILRAADAPANKIGGKLASKLTHGRDDARLAKILFTLKTDINLGINLNELRYQSRE